MAFSGATQSEVGVIGLDLAGRSMACRLAELDFNVAAFDWLEQNRTALRARTAEPRLRVEEGVRQMMAGLRQPRVILVFGSADAPTRFVLEQLLPELKAGDTVVDAGNSYFKDAPKHGSRLAERGVQFMGIGLGGGEKGARCGATVMAGGGREAQRQTRPLIDAMAATIRGERCVSYFESAAAAHFVKMVHTGIEYALLRLLSETFDLLQHALLLMEEELRDALGAWLVNVLNGHLMEISGRMFDTMDQPPPRQLLRETLQLAGCDPLGQWLTQSAWELEVPAPTLEAAMDIHRVRPDERRKALADASFRHPARRRRDDPRSFLDELPGALLAGIIITYAQGFALLMAASERFGFQFKPREISSAWRGCTQLRAALLEDITSAFKAMPDLPGLLSDDDLSERVMACQENLRRAVWRAHESDIPAPALHASLDYLDSKRTAWLPINLIQAPRREARRAPVQVARR